MRAFEEFLHRLPFYGLSILCLDDPNVRELADSVQRHVLTYGHAEDAQVRALEVEQDGPRTRFQLLLPELPPQPVTLNMPGRHNVQNALAAAAVGWQLGVGQDAIVQALETFQGIGRRFNLLGELRLPGGVRVQVVDDYGHHPRELAAVFEAARSGGRNGAWWWRSAHRYSRAICCDFPPYSRMWTRC